MTAVKSSAEDFPVGTQNDEMLIWNSGAFDESGFINRYGCKPWKNHLLHIANAFTVSCKKYGAPHLLQETVRTSTSNIYVVLVRWYGLVAYLGDLTH